MSPGRATPHCTVPSDGGAAAAPAAAPVAGAVPSWRLVATLAVAGALAGLLIVGVHGWAQPRIQEHQAEALREAVGEVLQGPERTERFFVHGGVLVRELPAGVDTLKAERVFRGYDASGEPVGFAVV
ncbi:MAG TPA: hypothetical protein VF150_13060, partial [Thermoanaerobaculia bacterium]